MKKNPIKLTSIFILYIFCALTITGNSQNTIGTIQNDSDSFDGYTLFTPNSNLIPNSTYLVNNCGEVINEWVSNFKGQGADLLMPDGSLFRASFDNQSTLIYAGNTGRIEHYDWDGSLIWGYTYSDTDFSFHHDYFPLPNGNILMIVAERMTNAQAVQAGRDPSNLIQGDLYNERIIEIQPVGTNSATIVWEWSLWDHLIQDFDPSKDNFGIVEDHPEKLDINFIGFSNNNADWTHLNSIDYNEDLDQIVISARFTSELYIIDHSTTIAEAASSSGGNVGKGGDFLYRWGNSQAYKRGTGIDQKLFGQHSVHWIPDGLPDSGKLMIFNNGFMRGYTTVEFLEPPLNVVDNSYDIVSNMPFGPVNGIIRYEDPTNQTDFFAPFLSSAYQLPNGNIIVNNGPVGQLFEANLANEKVWEYISPVLLDGTILSQEDSPAGINSRFFRARRYDPNYAAFDGRDLTPSAPIENNPILANCQLLSITDQDISNNINIYPNPTKGIININTSISLESYSIYDISGKRITNNTLRNLQNIDVRNLSKGLYFIELNEKDSRAVIRKKFIKH